MSEFILHAIQSYLERAKSEKKHIGQQYRKGYGNRDLSELTLEMKDWENEQVWPDLELFNHILQHPCTSFAIPSSF